MIDSIHLPASTSLGVVPITPAPTDLTIKYLHYLDEISHLKENTAHLLERSRRLSFTLHLWEEELFFMQSIASQKVFKESKDQLEADTQKLNILPSPTTAQNYYQKKFAETLEEMQDALQEHTDVLRKFESKITSLKDIPDYKSPPPPQKKQTKPTNRFFSIAKPVPASPETRSTPPLVRQRALWDISPLPSPTTPKSPFSPPPLSHQTTDVDLATREIPPLETSSSKERVILSLKRRDTDVTLLQDPVFLQQILRQGPPTKMSVSSSTTITTAVSPSPSLPKRLWRATRDFFSFKKREGWSRLD